MFNGMKAQLDFENLVEYWNSFDDNFINALLARYGFNDKDSLLSFFKMSIEEAEKVRVMFEAYDKDERKYEFTGETKRMHNGRTCYRTLHRIRLLRDIITFDRSIIKAGTIGGWIESENNLSHKGNCFVMDESNVYDNARVSDNAIVSGYSIIWDNAKIYGNAEVGKFVNIYNNAEVFGEAEIRGFAEISDNAKIFGGANINDKVKVSNNAMVFDIASLYDRVRVVDNAKIFGNAKLKDYACVEDDAEICGNVSLENRAHIKMDATLSGNMSIKGDSVIVGDSFKTRFICDL